MSAVTDHQLPTLATPEREQELTQERLNHADMRRTHAQEVISRVLRWSVLATLALLFIFRLSDVLLLIFAAILVAIVLRQVSLQIARFLPIGPLWSLGLLVLVLAGLFALFLVTAGESIAEQASAVSSQVISGLGSLQHTLEQKPWAKGLMDQVKDSLGNVGAPAAGAVAGVANRLFGIVGAVVVLAVTAIYLAIDPELYINGTLRLLPVRYRTRGREVLLSTGETLAWWFIGQFADMLFIGCLTFVGLWLLGVNLAGTLALIAALLNFVPYIGALMGAVPAIIVASGQGGDMVLWVIGLFLVIQSIEGNLFAPLIQRATVHLPPALTILSQTVLGTLFGPLGLILATPLVAAGMQLVRLVYVEGMLEGIPSPPARKGG